VAVKKEVRSLSVLCEQNLYTGDIGLTAVRVNDFGGCNDLFFFDITEKAVQGNLCSVNRP
jgi:hypothetical protein